MHNLLQRPARPGREGFVAIAAIAAAGWLALNACAGASPSGDATPTPNGSASAAPSPSDPLASVAASLAPPGSCHLRPGNLPDPICTPGLARTDVTQDSFLGTFCPAASTRSIRPPVAYTGALKIRQIAAYGYTDTSPRSYEEDHLIPLELGGDPRSPKNLWPQPYLPAPGAHEKDRVENAAHDAVCQGRLQLGQAQLQIAQDWISLGQQLGVL